MILLSSATTGATTGPQVTPSFSGTMPAQPSAGGAPNVVYVPRNVYVPVIKPVFVPRERTYQQVPIVIHSEN